MSGYRTDHSGITSKLKLNQNERGTRYWKFNNSLLKDKDYVQLVKKSMKEVTYIYKIHSNQQNRDTLDNNNNTESNGENAYSIKDQLLLEMILLIIQGETIKYSSRKKKEKNKQEKQLGEEISKLESNISENLEKVDLEEINLLEDKRNRK